MTRQEMADFLQRTWQRHPILARIAKAQSMTGPAQLKELRKILKEFDEQTKVKVETVEPGTVQALTKQPGNFASLRSKPGFLQIERVCQSVCVSSLVVTKYT
jgi:3-polyprenyl-4-hydroxybenzoate decarboxylase